MTPEPVTTWRWWLLPGTAMACWLAALLVFWRWGVHPVPDPGRPLFMLGAWHPDRCEVILGLAGLGGVFALLACGRRVARFPGRRPWRAIVLVATTVTLGPASVLAAMVLMLVGDTAVRLEPASPAGCHLVLAGGGGAMSWAGEIQIQRPGRWWTEPVGTGVRWDHPVGPAAPESWRLAWVGEHAELTILDRGARQVHTVDCD